MVAICPTFTCELRYHALNQHYASKHINNGLRRRLIDWKYGFFNKPSTLYSLDSVCPCIVPHFFWKVQLQHLSLWTSLPYQQPPSEWRMLSQFHHKKPYYSCSLHSSWPEIQARRTCPNVWYGTEIPILWTLLLWSSLPLFILI